MNSSILLVGTIVFLMYLENTKLRKCFNVETRHMQLVVMIMKMSHHYDLSQRNYRRSTFLVVRMDDIASINVNVLLWLCCRETLGVCNGHFCDRRGYMSGKTDQFCKVYGEDVSLLVDTRVSRLMRPCNKPDNLLSTSKFLFSRNYCTCRGGV